MISHKMKIQCYKRNVQGNKKKQLAMKHMSRNEKLYRIAERWSQRNI